VDYSQQLLAKDAKANAKVALQTMLMFAQVASQEPSYKQVNANIVIKTVLNAQFYPLPAQLVEGDLHYKPTNV